MVMVEMTNPITIHCKSIYRVFQKNAVKILCSILFPFLLTMWIIFVIESWHHFFVTPCTNYFLVSCVPVSFSEVMELSAHNTSQGRSQQTTWYRVLWDASTEELHVIRCVIQSLVVGHCSVGHQTSQLVPISDGLQSTKLTISKYWRGLNDWQSKSKSFSHLMNMKALFWDTLY